MTPVQIRALQTLIGTTPDGFWGPKSTAACQAHLRKLMPKVSPWPKSDSASLIKFYGEPGDESNLINLPAPVPMRYGVREIKTIRCHRKVGDSLARALTEAYKSAPAFVENYDGCFNFRKMRGGTSYSLHAWGAAIDLSAETNGNHTHWPTAATMPLSVMEAFAREGWLSAGAFWSRDSMHFQSTQ